MMWWDDMLFSGFEGCVTEEAVLCFVICNHVTSPWHVEDHSLSFSLSVMPCLLGRINSDKLIILTLMVWCEVNKLME